MKYIIETMRFDDSPSIYKKFEEKDDTEAIEHFNEIIKLPSNAWDYMVLRSEKKSFVAANEGYNRWLAKDD